MIKKIEFILAFLALVLIICLMLLWKNINSISQNKKDTIDNFNSKNEYIVKYNGDWEMIIDYFLAGSLDYTKMPLSKKFIEKYPNIESIIPYNSIRESADSVFDLPNDMTNVMTIRCKTEKGYEQIAYMLRYYINEFEELDDIEILDSRIYETENGSFPEYAHYKTYLENPNCAIYCLTNPKRYMDNGDVCCLTDNYMRNNSDYKTKSIIPWNGWLYIDEGTVEQDRINDRVWYLEAVNIEKIIKYKIEFIIDDRGYIDDYRIEELEIRDVLDKNIVLDEYNEVYR